MEKRQMKSLAILCFVLSAVFLFIAVERYQTNANNVRAMKQMMNHYSSQLAATNSQVVPAVKIKIAMPAITKYTLLLTVLSSAAGTILLVKSNSMVDDMA